MKCSLGKGTVFIAIFLRLAFDHDSSLVLQVSIEIVLAINLLASAYVRVSQSFSTL